jgi:hypothetical protein
MNKEYDVKILVGKTIQSIEIISAEYGRTYDSYTCFVCTDGTKIMLADGDSKPYSPKPKVDEMKKAPQFFTPDNIANRVKEIEIDKRQKIKQEQERKTREYNSLKKELGL